MDEGKVNSELKEHEGFLDKKDLKQDGNKPAKEEDEEEERNFKTVCPPAISASWLSSRQIGPLHEHRYWVLEFPSFSSAYGRRRLA